MTGFWETCPRVLTNRLATAHRPTVPPTGERTVIVIIAIAVTLTYHLFKARALAQSAPRLSVGDAPVKESAPLLFRVPTLVGFFSKERTRLKSVL
jgi:hypothetical protein